MFVLSKFSKIDLRIVDFVMPSTSENTVYFDSRITGKEHYVQPLELN